MQEYAHLLRSEMERQGIEGQQIAESLGIGQSMVSDIVNGKKKNPPSPDVFKGIGRILGLSQRRMMEALGYMDPDEGEAERAHPYPELFERAIHAVESATDEPLILRGIPSFVYSMRRAYDEQGHGE